MNIKEKLLAIQTELKAPKGQYNSFGNYKYRSAEDILEAVKPLLQKYKCLLTLSDEMQIIGQRYYIKAMAQIIDAEDKELQAITNSAFARENELKKGMDDSQISGTASSYARKYALNGLFLIDDTKDADTDEYQAQTQKQDKPKTTSTSKASDKQINLIKAKLNEERQKKLFAHYQIKDFSELNKTQALQIIEMINKESEGK